MAAKKKTKRKTKAQINAINQVMAVVLFTVGLLFFCLAVVKGSEGWLAVHNALLGLFGWSSFFIGPILIYIAVMSSMDKLSSNSLAFRTILSVVLLLLISAAFQIFLAGKPEASTLVAYVKSLYNDGIKLRGGGLFSAFLGFPLMLLGEPGDRIAVVLLIFLFTMILTGTTVAGFLRSAKKPVDKLATGYHELVNSIPVKEERQTDTASFAKPRRQASIDIPLGDEPVSKPKKTSAPKKEVSVSPDVLRSKKKLLQSAGVEQPEEELVTHASEEFLAAAAANAAAAKSSPTAAAAESEQPLIDDIINRVANLQQQKAKPVESSSEAVIEAAGELSAEPETTEPVVEIAPEPPAPPEYHLPPISLLREPTGNMGGVSADELRQNAQLLVDTLQSFGVQTRIIDISRGPAVTRYELQPSAGVKISKITSLADDIALNLASSGVRIEAPIPNKAAVGIEVPNRSITPVTLREVIDSKEFADAKSKVTVALGRDISGSLCFANIEKMPHLMIAGATGSGKSVCINTIIMSILFKAKPDEVKLLLIDPKEVELSVYNGLPHLVTPVVTVPKKAAGALGWAVSEMDTRYKLFAAHNVREINSFNRMVEAQQSNGGQDENAPKLSKMPHYIIIVDELADLMMTAPTDVEDHICRLAQKARAAGIHLIIATQRPSVDVITGVIKANIPSRIAFAVSSQIDSRTILDSAGAEKLLGMGDMLFAPVGSTKPTRIQGCFVSDEEIERVISFIKSAGSTEYDQQIIEEIDKHVPTGKSGGSSASQSGDSDGGDEMLNPAIECVVEAGIASTSLLQRKLKLGYARAARIIDELEARGIVGPFEGSKPRAVLISKERWLEMKVNQQNNTEQQ